MVEISPAAVVMIPLILIAIYNRQWAFYLLIGTVPFFALTLFVGLSHSFNPPEIMLIIFIGHYLVDWISQGRVEIQNPSPIVFMWAFIGVATVSVILASFWPSTVMVHPYDSTFQSRLFVEPSVSMKNITQLLLRIFFVLGVTVLAASLSVKRRIETAVRVVVVGALFAGLVGVLYQLLVVLDITDVLSVLAAIGFADVPLTPGSMGPIPRMYSTPGEPGFTADYLLYALALTFSLVILPGQSSVFSQREAVWYTTVLFACLLLSTATTGYGGLLILFAITVALLLFIPSLRPNNLARLTSVLTGIVIIGGLLAVFISNGWVVEVVARQVEKMAFQAGSGRIRFFYIQKSILVFLERPIFGAGVGTHHAPSYFFTLLAETGLLGMMLLIGAHFVAFRQCMGILMESSTNPRPLVAATLIAGLTLLLTSLIAKSISSLLLPWYWFGISIPIAIVARNSGVMGEYISENVGSVTGQTSPKPERMDQ